MLPVAFANHKCPSFAELSSLSIFGRVSHTSHSRKTLKKANQPNVEENKAIQGRLRPPIRSLLDVDTLKSMLLKTVEESPVKVKVKEKLPPLNDSVCGKSDKPCRLGREASYAYSKYLHKSALDLPPRPAKSLLSQSPVPKPEEIDKTLQIIKVQASKFVVKRDIHRRNHSIDLKASVCEDKGGLFNATFDAGSQLMKTFSDGLQRYSESASDSSDTGNSNQDVGRTAPEVTVTCHPPTLESLEDHSNTAISDPPVPLTCSCPQVVYKQSNLHFRQCFDRRASRYSLPSPQALFVDRKSAGDTRPTLAILFDGVIGDSFKRCLTDTSPKSIRLRKNSIVGLQWLQQTFHLVFVSYMRRGKATKILAYFRTARVVFTAAYLVPQKVAKGAVLDYSEICEDLNILPQNLLLVTSLDLSYDDLLPADESVLYIKAGTRLRLLANALPSSRTEPPLTFLVPSLKPQHNSDVLPFDLIAGAIQRIRKGRNWQEDFERLQETPCGEFATFSTAVIYEAALSQMLSVPRADALRRATEGKCTLHKVAVWSESPKTVENDIVVLTTTPSSSGVKGGFEVIETKALRVKSGFLNLLDYTTVESSPQKMKINLAESM